MSSLFDSTLNTRPLPVGSLRFIRSDYPGSLSDSYLRMLDGQMDKIISTIMNADINIIIPNEENIKKVLESINCA